MRPAAAVVGLIFGLAALSANAQSVNVAAAANGGVATASSSLNASYPVSSVIDGDRIGANWGNGGGWNDGTFRTYPDWVQVTFSGGVKVIGEIDVITLQSSGPVNPTPTLTFTNWGNTAFQVQYWNGTAWVTVPGGAVFGNNLVWRRFTFPPVATDRIRVLVSDSGDHVYSRLIELEAWTAPLAVSLDSPASNTMLAAPGTVSLSASAYDTGGIGKVEFYRDATLIATATTPSSGTSTSGTYTATDSNVPVGNYLYTAKAYDAANSGVYQSSGAAVVSVTAVNAQSVNVAAATNGGVASASSTINANYPAAAAINGDRKGLNNGAGGVWNDATQNAFPDWLQVNFNGP